jgi:ATP-binding cassette subfamily B multidrug efflux pump
MSAVTGKAFDKRLLKRILDYVRPYKKAYYISIFLTCSIAFIAPLRPLLIQYTFDNYIMVPNAEMLLRMTVLMVGLLLFQSVIQYYQTYLTSWLGQSVIRDMRTRLYRHIVNLRLKFFDNTPIGTLQTRVISDMETIADIFSEGLIIMIGDILQLVVIIIWMFCISWKLSLISLSSIPLLLVATRFFQKGIKEAFKEVRVQVAHLNTFVQEHLTGMSIVQIFNRESIEMEKFDAINKLHADANIRSVWYYSIFFPIVEILSAASIGLLVWWGAGEAIHNEVSLGVIVAFIMYINMMFRPIRELADKFNVLQMGMVSSERIFNLMDTDAFIQDTGTLVKEDIKGDIVFENVWFAYNDENWILKDVSFTVAAGQSIALVGATGAGKSSVINILTRFYEINKGKITIDGIDIKNFKLQDLRKKMAVVMQDVFLFSNTIANNISLSDPSIPLSQMMEAAKAIGADKFIESLPGQFNYNVRERGATLSAGQRQLIAFIRTYVYNPKILILDEATSSIDSESESLIQQATNTLTKGRTSIIIAHRLSTVQKADKILVLDAGEIKESGTHQELLRQNGMYKNLYDVQFKNKGK